jgi:hypothetical protein
VAYGDITGVIPEQTGAAPNTAISSEGTRSLLVGALGDVTVVLKDGSIEEYNAQTATRSGAISALEAANLSEVSVDALAQALLSNRFTARQEALQELEKRAPGTLKLGRLNKEQLNVVTALCKAGHAAAAADMLVASGMITATTDAPRWEFPKLASPETPNGPRLLSAAVGGSSYTLSEGKNGGTRLLIKSPGSKHARQTMSLQKPTGDNPKVAAPSLTSSLLGVSSKGDLNSNAILPNENNDPATRAHNARVAAQFGAKNLLVAVSGTTPGSSGMEDAWSFLNNNPGANTKYARPNEDVIPYFFPGGEYSQKYYNWQVKTGARRKLSTAEIMQESEGMVYAMLKSQIAEQQIAGYYTGEWYVEQIARLDKQFGGARPVDTLVTGISDARIAVVEKALQDPAMQSSPVYKQISEFYPVFKKFKDSLNEIKVSNYAELSSKGGLPTLMRDELVALGEKLMTENPDFIRMYYGVFAGILKESK